MSERQTSPYGSWRSPITAASIVGGTTSISEPRCTGSDLYWLESRPQEGGRSVVVRRSQGGRPDDVTPAGFNARTRVHEYGGGSYAVHGDTVYFANFADQRVYRQPLGGLPQPITPEPPAPASLRFADFDVSPDGRFLYCVRETHDAAGVHNDLVVLATDGLSSGERIVAGRDFYSSPRVSSDGRRLAWLCWDHPNMPWDDSELWLADLEADGRVADLRPIAGGEDVSIFEPEWGPSGDGKSEALYYTEDESGWWLPARFEGSESEVLYDGELEFGQPQWVFGLTRYAALNDGTLVFIATAEGLDRLIVRRPGGAISEPSLPFNVLHSIAGDGRRVYLVAASPTTAAELIEFDPGSGAFTVVRESSGLALDPGYISVAQSIAFPTEGGHTAHAFYYPPVNKDFVAPEGEAPPLLVHSHGGPTGATDPALDPRIQFWTSRGFAVVDVNYRGSAGYGRDYRDKLKGVWGIADVEDCANAARYLVDQGLADPRRLAVRGGSAGGYTTLASLAFTDVFTAGASHFGVSDLERLALDTHKFESRYLDGLVGPYPAERETYRDRSPIHSASRIDAPIILFQGLDDKVVPPSQAEMMVDALDERRIPHAYIVYEGEGHGFRKAENIQRTLESELAFYGRIWGFEPADPIDAPEIAHLT